LTGRTRRWLRGLGGPLILVGVGLTVDVRAVLGRLAALEAPWVLAALAVGVGQTLLSAWRWRYTAGRLGLTLPFTLALREYYRALFLNQVLPGGVLGDADRAWRHSGRAPEARGPAVRAVILERLSGQVVMAGVASLSFAVIALGAGTGTLGWWVASLGVAAVAGVAVAVAVRAPGGSAPASVTAALRRDARAALFSGEAVYVQLTTSAVIVASYVAAYLLAARAVGVEAPLVELAPLVAPVLLSMLLPLSVGGWGVRETTAAAVWSVAGLGASDGVAISVAYGMIVLVGTLPGAYALLFGGVAGPVSVASEPIGEPAGPARRSRSKRMSAPSRK
jgi:glycosyltransferase 2 family protein